MAVSFFFFLFCTVLTNQQPIQPESNNHYIIKISKKADIVSEKDIELTKSIKVSDVVLAEGVFEDTTLSNGFSQLHIRFVSCDQDSNHAYSAGYLEGYLTRDKIFQFLSNTKDSHDKTVWKDLISYNKKQNNFLRRMSHNSQDPYWQHVGLILRQLDGILDGYNAADKRCLLDHGCVSHPLDMEMLYLINMDGDNGDLESFFARSWSREIETNQQDENLIQTMQKSSLKIFEEARLRLLKNSKDLQAWELFSQRGRCSALIKVADGDIFVGHTTFEPYEEMIRIYKFYDFPFKDVPVQATKISFSSYPAMISSTDDWYIMDNGLVIIETSISPLDASIYDSLDLDKTVTSWVRAMVSNRLAHDGDSWSSLFKKYNSGTYNCQWMILNYNRISGSHLNSGAFFLVEQMGRKIVAQDLTETLKSRGYWPSVNSPYFSEIREYAGYQFDATTQSDLESVLSKSHVTKDDMDLTSFERNPRGLMLARGQKNVYNLEDMMHLMRYNNWQNDPLSLGSAGLAISARYDLDPRYGLPFGGVDAKVTNTEFVRQITCKFISGPTHENQPVFESAKWEGMPQKWDFDWIEVSPLLP